MFKKFSFFFYQILKFFDNILTYSTNKSFLSWFKEFLIEDSYKKIIINQKQTIFFIPNNSFLGSRTKIFHALSCGLPVITHECNIRFHPNLVNKKNILKANDFEHMKTLITDFLSGNIDADKLSLNSRIAFEEGYKKDAILDLLVNKIENIH